MMRLKSIKHCCDIAFGFFAFWYSMAVWATDVPNAGDVANNALEPASSVVEVMYNICYLLGVALFLSGVLRYTEHRANPTGVPLSQAIVRMILGVVTFFLPFLGKLSGIDLE